MRNACCAVIAVLAGWRWGQAFGFTEGLFAFMFCFVFVQWVVEQFTKGES